jgi:hypothetical protein
LIADKDDYYSTISHRQHASKLVPALTYDKKTTEKVLISLNANLI